VHSNYTHFQVMYKPCRKNSLIFSTKRPPLVLFLPFPGSLSSTSPAESFRYVPPFSRGREWGRMNKGLSELIRQPRWQPSFFFTSRYHTSGAGSALSPFIISHYSYLCSRTLIPFPRIRHHFPFIALQSLTLITLHQAAHQSVGLDIRALLLQYNISNLLWISILKPKYLSSREEKSRQ